MKPRATRIELLAVLVVLATGCGLRACAPARISVEHFDEGVYASGLYTPQTGERFPDLHLYAPPLFPTLCYWATVFGGPHAPIWINIVAGSLTLLVLWGMVRDWFGRAAALLAMTLLAFSEFHIAYSRAVLTDALLGLWLTTGVWCGARAIRFGGPLRILVAGTAAGLAWWTKYNGWLTLAITGAGTAGWLVFRAIFPGRPADASPAGLATTPSAVTCGWRWLAVATVAGLVWAPCLWQLQAYGGYAAVAKNHAGYFGGVTTWGNNLQQQLAAVGHYSGAVTIVGLLVSVILLVLAGRRWSDDSGAVGAASMPRSGVAQGVWIAAAWFLGLTVAVPLYRPYPRLMLPWLPGVVVCIAGAAHVWASRPRRNAGRPRTHAPHWAIPGALVLGGLVAAAFVAYDITSASTTPRPSSAGAWQNRTALRRIAATIIDRLRAEPMRQDFEGYRCAIYVLAEPGLFYHLAAAQSDSPIRHLTQAASDYGMARPGGHRAPIPAFVAIGSHADAAEAERLVATGQLELVAEFEDLPSDLVLLDEMSASDLEQRPEAIVRLVRLFHVKPGGTRN